MSGKDPAAVAESVSIEGHDRPASEPDAKSDASDVDDSYAAYRRLSTREIEPAEAKRVLRKIDTRIIPILFFLYLIQYLDKNSLNFASAYGLKEDTHLVGQDYSWLGSIFYFGYLVAQYPSGYLMQRLPIGKVLSVTALIWGVILMTTPACTSFAGIATNRFMLGFVEAAVNPGESDIRGMLQLKDD